ncbi:hypothetical protein [Mycolicibacter icosiumassiliensis]|uniref:hypothetical protein n=1 Tax=Mycolicibacter icosiumassiliensis TaxID=1792835 RepID=UPI0012B69B32|nr:hypothetical protein [Mycolicibacter icosiumassiliensis]
MATASEITLTPDEITDIVNVLNSLTNALAGLQGSISQNVTPKDIATAANFTAGVIVALAPFVGPAISGICTLVNLIIDFGEEAA